VSISEEDVKKQEVRVKELRKKLELALCDYQQLKSKKT
jgi:hypothetical protein